MKEISIYKAQKTISTLEIEGAVICLRVELPSIEYMTQSEILRRYL